MSSRIWAALVLLPLMVGCVESRAEEGRSIFTFASWLSLTLWALTLVFLVVSIWAIRARFWNLLGVTAILTVIFAGIISPSISSDRVIVSAKRFRLETGFWFDPTIHDVLFDDLGAIGVHRGKETDLICVLLSGEREIVPVGDLMKRGPMETILTAAREAGVPVIELNQP